MKATLPTLTFIAFLSSGAALAYEDSAQRDSRLEEGTMRVHAVSSTAEREATAPGAPQKPQVSNVAAQAQPDPNFMPYVNEGWYGQ